ncbi:hypothetical protein MKW98_031384, partial [Papaver atlanticum]
LVVIRNIGLKANSQAKADDTGSKWCALTSIQFTRFINSLLLIQTWCKRFSSNFGLFRIHGM